MNILSINKGSEIFRYKLLEKKEDIGNFFGEIYTYVQSLMSYLWDNPIVVSKLVIHSKKEDLKQNLVPLIVNNFYENILSSNYIEDHLLYIICLVLKDEIDNRITGQSDYKNFLEDTPCGILLEELIMKQDVQTYFKTLIFKMVSYLEEENSSYEINFNVKYIHNEFNKTKEVIEAEYKKTGKKHKVIASDYFRRNNEGSIDSDLSNDGNKLFTSKYIISFSKEEYTLLLSKNQENKIMNDFLSSQSQACMDNPNIFSNETLLKNVFQLEHSKEILASYQIDFTKTIKILDEFLKSLFNYLYLLPYSVKCICKIIILMIRRKFKDWKIVEQNAFISKFFFHKLFSPILENPGMRALINNFIISGVTRHNLNVISFILKQLFSGKFFVDGSSESDYTPFNWYFIDKIQDVYSFFENITQVKLPPFIEKLINNELPESFVYNYFQENPEEGFFHRSICFNFKDLCVILNNMKNLKDKIFVSEDTKYIQKSFEKLVNKSGIAMIEKIKKNIKYEMITPADSKKKKDVKSLPILNFFLFSELLTNEKYKKIFSMEQEKASFSLPELKTTQTDEENWKNNVIKIKNFLCALLNNYRVLVKTDFVEGTTNNTISILSYLKKYMKVSNFVIDGSIPSEWYVDSFLEYMKKIPPDLIANDCDFIYRELESDLNSSIKELDFESLSVILGKVKFCKRGITYYEKMKTLLIDIKLNEKVQKIIENEPIFVELEFKYNNKYKELKIKKSNKKDIRINSYDNIVLNKAIQKTYYCGTIKSFTKIFPNISKYHQIIEKNLTDMENDLKLTQNLMNYFKIINDYLMSENSSVYNLIGTREFGNISIKIYDYVMEKLYDKIFPREPDPSDYKICDQCKQFSWIEPKNFIKSKINFVFDSFLPDVIDYFKEIDTQKSPRKKLLYMSQIFQSISNVVKFSGGGSSGVDDIMPILNYSFIKAKPPHMSSNCKYMELFIGEKKNKEEGNQLAQLKGICNFVENMSIDKLYGVSQTQLNKSSMS